MTLPRYLLRAIVRNAPEGERLRVAREWERRLPEMQAAAERIRAQVAAARCRCHYPGRIEGGRCSKCMGQLQKDHGS
jgi:hypothetical protein